MEKKKENVANSGLTKEQYYAHLKKELNNPKIEKLPLSRRRHAHHRPVQKKQEDPAVDLLGIKTEIENSIAQDSKQPGQPVDKTRYIQTGIPGFDGLFSEGIPKGNAVLLAGGAGSGKTIFSLQLLYHHANLGNKCIYMSFEESESKLIQHMKDFGWNPEPLIRSGHLVIKRYSPFEITRSVNAMLEKEKGELLIDLHPVILPKDFKPDIVVVDSLTAIGSTFNSREDSYRIYIEQLFRFFENMNANSFLITETKQIPEVFSTTGVEEFLADGVIVLYNIQRGDVRENAIEVLKMRGEKHKKKIVAMEVSSSGITVYPEQEIFGGIKKE